MSEPHGRSGPPPPDPLLSGGTRRTYSLYLLPLVLLPCVLLLSAFFIVPTAWFTYRSGSSYLANMGYATRLHNTVCDILIYGDSSAMLSVDPAVLKAATGLTACNIAEFEGITLTNRTEMVDVFLQNNPPPRFLLFLYAPEDLRITSTWPKISMVEAISYNVQYKHNFNTLKMLLLHPGETFAWAELGMRGAIEHARAPVMSPQVIHLREATHGIFPYPPSVAHECLPGSRRVLPDLAWLSFLRTHYGVNGTRVLIDATPLAPCDPDLGFFGDHLKSVIDDFPYPVIPITSFQEEGRLHTNAQGVALISSMIANQINAARGSASIPSRNASLAGSR